MFRGVFRATRIALDGRNRFPVDIKYTRTRKRNDRKRLAIVQENARIIREGRKALLARLSQEAQQQKQAVQPDDAKSAVSAKARQMAQTFSSTISEAPSTSSSPATAPEPSNPTTTTTTPSPM